MAASVPPLNVTTEWVQSKQRSNQGQGTRLLELGMSGMSLMPSFGSRDYSNSDMASPVGEPVTTSYHEQRKFDSGDSVQSQRSSNASPLPSGGSLGPGSVKGISRPPGLGVSVASPIDGGSDFYNMGRHSSPFRGDGPSISSDYSSKRGKDGELPPGLSNFGSFDTDDGEHDGLHGLQALRDRANGSGYSSSPPVRVHVGSFDDNRNVFPEQHRPRAVSRDSGRSQSGASRPPLSGGAGLSPLTTEQKVYQAERGVAGVGMSFSSRSRDPSPPPYSQDLNDSRAPGVISRPGYSQYGGEPERMFDPSLRRSIGSDTGREDLYDAYGTNQYGQVTALSPHVNQQRLHSQNLQAGQHTFQRHQRSASQPGPMRGSGVQPDAYHEIQHRRGSDYGVGTHRLPPGMENDYSDTRYHSHPSQSQSHHSRSVDNMQHGRSLSMSHGSVTLHDGHPPVTQRRSSLQPMHTGGSGFYGYNVHRRESLDFVPGHNRYPEGVPVVASSKELRMFANSDNDRVGNNFQRHERLVSPAQSPLHPNYGSHHSRHPSDMGSSAMSSSPMSLGSSELRGVQGQSHDIYGGPSRAHHRVPSSDDDLHHPLLGEHIEVPGDDMSYMMNEGASSHPHMRSSMGPSGGSDQLPHYGSLETSHHHLPTAGSALPMPKVVYNVKFKRTQRSFVLGPRLNRDLKIGTYVKVEADRGEDLGIVIGKVPSEKFSVSTRGSFRGGMGEMGMMPPPSGLAAPGSTDLKRIIRLATHDEVALLQMKREEEDELLKICRTKVRQRALPMNVVDAEYQFDRHKLTFFFEAEGRVDFRELVRDLFSMYKTRIWMQQLDKNTSATCPTGPQQPQPIVMDYGTPIIAPESEYSDFSQINGASGDEITD